jgi:hypothetical protein
LCSNVNGCSPNLDPVYNRDSISAPLHLALDCSSDHEAEETTEPLIVAAQEACQTLSSATKEGHGTLVLCATYGIYMTME